MSNFNSIEEAVADIEQGKMVIVVDDESRENEGDLVMAADKITSEAVNFMATHGKGLICTPITARRANDLDLPLMAQNNNSKNETAFTISVDSVHAGTGISCDDRALTISALVNSETNASELLRPGHIFPLIAKEGGVLQRAGHTEAAVDLAKLAGLSPAAVICEIMNDNGTMAMTDDLMAMAKKFDLKLICIEDLIEFRRKKEVNARPMIEEISCIDFPNKYGDFKLHAFKSSVSVDQPHIALVKGEINPKEPTLVRVHSECFTGDIFGSLRCDCGEQLEMSMKIIEESEKGILLYMRQEGRGIGLHNKIKAYALQDRGYDTVMANNKLGFKADLREYGIGAQILKYLGAGKVRILTNNPKKIVGIEAFDLEVVERCPIEVESNEINKFYLTTKRDKLGHMISNI